MKIQYGFGKTIFGSTFLAVSEKKILQLSFVSSASESAELKKMKRHWPQAELLKQKSTWVQKELDALIPQVFSKKKASRFEMVTQGTAFQNKVWKALLEIPAGQTTTYSEIAKKIGHPKAVRAVGSAVGANPIGYLIPCHRVLPKSGGIGQFGWGPKLKQEMLQFETVQLK
jgi:AraC family transcriptional regulator of adaptative response/methylated-DNA-[protein]-cysteine methyltransferase